MSKKQIAFIGCGAVSELHFQALKECPGALLSGIYDIDPVLSEKRSLQWGVRAHDTLESLLGDSSIDAVFVLSPVHLHHNHVMAALNAGKHVLVEKPVASEISEIEEMAALASRKGLVCMPAHNYIYSPDMFRLKKNLEAGNLGTIAVSWLLYHISHGESLQARYPGIIRQIGTHLLYVHRFLFGSPSSMSAQATRVLFPALQRDDQAMISLIMPDGSISNLFASFAVSDNSSSPWTVLIKVLGTKGSVQISWQDVVFERALGTLSRAYDRYEETYEHEIRFFIHECLENGKAPLSTLDDALIVLKLVIEAEKMTLDRKDLVL